MGIFSFGNKDDSSTGRGANSGPSRGKRTERTERVERRSRRTDRAGDADAMLLDPTLPEKQRARRRLVGAIALVVAAVVILPMVLDSHPKPVTDDISIDIPSRPAPKVRPTDSEDTQAGVAPDNPAPSAAIGASGLVAASSATAATSATSTTSSTSSSAPGSKIANSAANSASQRTAQTATASSAPAGKPSAAAGAGNTTNAANTANKSNAASAPKAKPAPKVAATQPPADTADDAAPGAAAAEADSGTPAAPPGSRFAVQLGSFPDDASARTWANKLKAAGVPAYTERRKQADGSFRTLLRAGPVPDRAAATAAIAKVREAGLTSGANNGSAQ